MGLETLILPYPQRAVKYCWKGKRGRGKKDPLKAHTIEECEEKEERGENRERQIGYGIERKGSK